MGKGSEYHTSVASRPLCDTLEGLSPWFSPSLTKTREPGETSAPGASILLVEDSRTQGIQMSYLLEKEGWQVRWAQTAQEAIEEINQRVRPT